MLRQPHAAVYRAPRHGEARNLFGCSDYHRTFEFTNDAIALPPAMDLHGLLLAWVAGSIDDGAEIRVTPLSDAQESDIWLATPVRIGSLRVSRHGTVVWIGCALPRTLWDDFRGNGRTPPPLGPGPSCLTPGPASNTVYLQTVRANAAGTDPQILDRGAWLDPRSLQRTGNVMTWLRAGRRHRYEVTSDP